MKVVTLLRALPARLARITSGGKIIREIDGMRFLAIILVVIQHLSERFQRDTTIAFDRGVEYAVATFITARGFLGVHIFFAISGFILGLPFASYYLNGGKKISLKSYFWRRLTRLEPPYIISLIGIAILWIVVRNASVTELVPHFIASLLYVHSLVYGYWSTINPPVWSLEVEVQFYILAPFLALLFFKIQNKLIRRSAFVGFILLWMLLQQYVEIDTQGFTLFSLFAHIHIFLAGFILVDIYLTEWKNGIPKHAIFNYIALGSLALIVWLWSNDLPNRILFVIGIFMILYSIFRATWLNRFFSLPWITAIGGMCYSIYLIHMPILEGYIRISRHIAVTNIFTLNYIIQFALVVPLLLACSIIFYLLIEKPCMDKDWPQKLMKFFKGDNT